MAEGALVSKVEKTLQAQLPRSLVVRRHAALLYQVRVDTNLSVDVNPQEPVRGQSAFETDICIFEKHLVRDESNAKAKKYKLLLIPRVVFEFKVGLSTHDVLTYSAKARKHKDIYPYLRYGLVTARHGSVPGRFFTHNEALDFCLALGDVPARKQVALIARTVRAEIKSSRRLERIAFERDQAYLFRTDLKLSRRQRRAP